MLKEQEKDEHKSQIWFKALWTVKLTKLINFRTKQVR